MLQIAFDESGFTGQDLLNKVQPVFCLASINFSKDNAEYLLSFVRNKSREYKFNKLRKNAGFKKQLNKVLNDDSICEKNVKLAIGHKEYIIIAQIVDKLIEPVLYKIDIDIYRQGLNLSLTNLLYYCIPVLCNNIVADQVKFNFIQMFRKKDQTSIYSFYSSINDLIQSCTYEKFLPILNLIYSSKRLINKILSHEDIYQLDISSTSFVALCDAWGRTLNEKFDVLVDASKPIQHYSAIYEKIKSENIQEQEIGYGSRKFLLPFKINQIQYVDSSLFPQIQLADLIAGAGAYHGKATSTNQPDELSTIISNSKISNLFECPIWPHQSITPEELNMDDTGNNPIDKIIELTKKY